MRTLVSLHFLAFPLTIACADVQPKTDPAIDSGDAAEEGSGDANADNGDDTSFEDDSPADDNSPSEDGYLEMEDVDNAICAEQYSVCGDLLIPPNISGTARSLAVVLYSTVPPAGPPDGIVAEIEAPNIMGGYRFPIRELPVLFTGEYYLWVNLYMEGGGEWQPVNDIDYTGYSANPITLDGSPIEFDDIMLTLASGW